MKGLGRDEYWKNDRETLHGGGLKEPLRGEGIGKG